MDRYARMARSHWQSYLPTLYEELTESGRLDEAIEQAVEQARTEIAELQAAGYQLHEAEETVLPRYILLTPPADEDDWDDLMTDEDRERLAIMTGCARDMDRFRSL
ncbi:MAG: hypothetical protein HYU74_03135 [Dechloromonas sp.]|nr:hypothetical protein [Dechloromonas sp.]